MSDDKRSQSAMDKVWNFFTSLKLAITILIILAVASVFGTIIEQNQPIEKYRQFYGDATIRMLDALNLFDMYHSWWFLLLLVLFTVNLSCCTLDRLPRVVKVVRNPKTTLDDNLEKSLGLVARWKKKGSPDAWADRYAGAMGKSIGKPLVTRSSEAVHLYAEKGIVSRFGVYVTHTSIVIIFIGAIFGKISGKPLVTRSSEAEHLYAEKGIVSRFGVYVPHTSIVIIFIGAIFGNVLGFKGFVNILEGQSIRQVP